jgi:plasmid replication initiation protein
MNEKKKKILKQHNAITEARYEMSALEKNIFYLLLAELKDDDPENRIYYKINFFELEKKFGKKVTIVELAKAAEGLVFRVYTIKKENGGELDTALVSSVENMPEENSIELGVSPMARPYLLALKKDYTEFQLDTALKLKSKYSKRMYEMLSQHKNEGKITFSVEELKYRLAIVDAKTGQDKYPGWRQFAMHILERPQKELAEHADIAFTYTLKKTGRKYTDIEFHIEFHIVKKDSLEIPKGAQHQLELDL